MTQTGQEIKEKMEKLAIAIENVNEVLDLDPRINTVLETEAKGAQLNKARETFVTQMQAELVEVLVTRDGDGGRYFVEPTDVEKMTPETQSVIKELLTDEDATRLFPEPVKKEKRKRKDLGETTLMIQGLISEGKWKRKEIIEKVCAEHQTSLPSTINTRITDGKNPKYNKFSLLVKEDPETKILSFE